MYTLRPLGTLDRLMTWEMKKQNPRLHCFLRWDITVFRWDITGLLFMEHISEKLGDVGVPRRRL